MNDIANAIKDHIETARKAMLPSVDLAAPEVIICLRVKVRAFDSGIDVVDDDTPVKLRHLQAELEQYGQDRGRQNAALQERICALERKLNEQDTSLLRLLHAIGSTTGKCDAHEMRLNLIRDQIEGIVSRMNSPRILAHRIPINSKVTEYKPYSLQKALKLRWARIKTWIGGLDG